MSLIKVKVNVLDCKNCHHSNRDLEPSPAGGPKSGHTVLQFDISEKSRVQNNVKFTRL